MEKITPHLPEKIQVVGNKIIVSEKVFDTILDALKLQTETINQLIDALHEVSGTVEEHDTKLTTLNTSVQTMANALKTVMEE